MSGLAEDGRTTLWNENQTLCNALLTEVWLHTTYAADGTRGF